MKTFRKHIILTALVLPALLLTGCSKALENGSGAQEQKSTPAEKTGGFEFEAYAVDEIDFGATKTWLTPDYKVAWIDGDQVKTPGGGTYSAVILGDEVTHAFLAPATPSDKMMPDGEGYYKVYYPATLIQGTSTVLPANQYWNAENILGVNPMYAKDTCEVLQFHNVCGLLQLRLKGTATVSKIEVWADKAISGKFSIVEGMEDGVTTYTAKTDNAAASESTHLGVTLDCTKPSATGTAYPEGGVILSKEGSLFYIAIPDSTYKWMKVRVTDKNGYVSYKKIDETIKIKRNTVYYTEFTPVWGVMLNANGPVWSACNIGVENEWEYGGYYCWAGTEPLYRTCGSTLSGDKYEVTFTPDCWKGGFQEGYVKENAAFYDKYASTPAWYKYTAADGKTELDPQDDPVTMTMGPSWRTPTATELAQLAGGSAATRNGIAGAEFTGYDGTSKLFIPYAGYAEGIEVKDAGTAMKLWSNTKVDDDNATGSDGSAAASYGKHLGFSVRGVCPTASTGEY